MRKLEIVAYLGKDTVNSVFDILNFKYQRNGSSVGFRNLFHASDGSQPESMRQAGRTEHRLNGVSGDHSQ